jgi:LacI family transcriptional regulator
MTVSRAFGGKSGVAEATQTRIREVAQRLGYRPNRVAQGLATKRTRTLGLVVSSDRSLSAVLRGAEATAREHGYSILTTLPGRRVGVERERVELLLERRVDGLLLVSTSDMEQHEHVRGLWREGIPLVTINRYCEEMGFWRLFFDYGGAARAVTRKLLAAGHRRIAFVGGAPDYHERSVRERIAGYREALRDASAWTPDAEVFGGVLPENGAALTETLLRQCPGVTAILAVKDRTAAGVLRALRRLQRRVPDDVAVIGFDDTETATCTDPPLSSVRSAHDEAGRTGCRLLIEQMEQPDREGGTLLLPSSLVVRESCGLGSGHAAEESFALG